MEYFGTAWLERREARTLQDSFLSLLNVATPMVVSTDAVESSVCNLSSVLFRHGNFSHSSRLDLEDESRELPNDDLINPGIRLANAKEFRLPGLLLLGLLSIS